MKRYLTMTDEYATKLMSDLLDAFGIAFSVWPIMIISNSMLHPEEGILYRSRELISKLSIDKIKEHLIQDEFSFIVNSPDAEGNLVGHLHVHKHKVSDEKIVNTDAFDITLGNRKFKILIYDEPDNLGFGTCLPDYDYGTYLCAEITELREDGSKKHNLIFGFDVQKMQFLELFELKWINQIGTIREPKNIDRLEKLFYRKDILQFQVQH